MPVVAREGEFVFYIYAREHAFEPPHVHVRFGGQEVRIELNGGTFMEQPPPGKRRAILRAYGRHAAKLRAKWAELHGR